MPIRMSGLASGMDTESIIKELMTAQRTKTTKIQNKITKLEWKQDKWKDLNKKIYALYTDSLSKLRMQGNYNLKKAISSNTDKVEVSASGSVPEGQHTIQVKSVASAQFITGSKLEGSANASYSTKLVDLGMEGSVGSSIKISTGGKETILDISADTTIADFVSKLQEAGLNASFDSTQQRFFISSRKSGIENAFEITSADADNPVQFDKLGLSEITKTVDNDNGTVSISVGANVSKIDPSDAIIVYNNAEIRNSTNSITVNGLTVTVKGVTVSNESISVTISKDAQAIYDMIKGFVKSYNEVLKALNEAYDADLAKGYEPLTDEQREVMTEEQIEKWEKKIKDSLLRRDGTVGSLINTMRTALSGSVQYNGKSYSLATFGITSVKYTEKGLLHIDGDKDDELTASEDDELMKALADNPDAVMTLFTKLTGDLYKTMQEDLKSTSISSAMSFYNDKEIKNTLDDYKQELSDMEKRLLKIEDRYYKQFTAMETMISKMNSQSSSIMSLLGMNNPQ